MTCAAVHSDAVIPVVAFGVKQWQEEVNGLFREAALRDSQLSQNIRPQALFPAGTHSGRADSRRQRRPSSRESGAW